MQLTILSSQQAKKSRESLGLSQGKVATDLKLNRSYLSQFESGKRLFGDEELTLLRRHYEDMGFDFDDTPTKSGNGINVMDGFAIPFSMSPDDADILLTEYAENKDQIDELSSTEIDKGFFSGIDDEDREAKSRKILCLMARNYSLIEQIHGHKTIVPCHTSQIDESKSTVGEFISLEFAEEFGSRG